MISPIVSVVMPVFNTAAYVEEAVQSVLSQSFQNFELIIVDDQGTDNSIDLCRQIDDPRIRIISQENRGLAGARNTGIRNARGKFIALLDSDDVWEPKKLALHVAHLNQSPNIGISYAASRLIDDSGKLLSIVQQPKRTKISAATIFLRNPVGNGSAPVLRRQVFEAIAYKSDRPGEMNYFDEDFRQSEDIECWIRIALTTDWKFEGIRGAWTDYRVNACGLSANVITQYESWLKVRDKVRSIAPGFAAKWENAAEAYQLRYLARRSIHMHDRGLAVQLVLQAIKKHPWILLAEPTKTCATLIAAVLLRFLPDAVYARLQSTLMDA